jgi:hypothetical protein
MCDNSHYDETDPTTTRIRCSPRYTMTLLVWLYGCSKFNVYAFHTISPPWARPRPRYRQRHPHSCERKRSVLNSSPSNHQQQEQQKSRTWKVDSTRKMGVNDERSRSRRKMKPMPITGYNAKEIEEYYDRRPWQVGWRLNSLGLPLLGKKKSTLVELYCIVSYQERNKGTRTTVSNISCDVSIWIQPGIWVC